MNELNQASASNAADAFAQCCAASDWIAAMVDARPFEDLSGLLAAADSVWQKMDENNRLEAFSAHPQIGNVDSLRAKYAATKSLAAGEQSSVAAASDAVLQALAQGNREYLEKFGFIFIVCATGKSAQEMLDLLLARLPNRRERELDIAAEEQRKITAIRLRKLVGGYQ